jgi:hypothetical protein
MIEKINNIFNSTNPKLLILRVFVTFHIVTTLWVANIYDAGCVVQRSMFRVDGL